jgi:hypothetical protein
MRECEAVHALIHEPTAGVAKENEQFADCVAVNASDSLCGSDRHALGQQVQDQLGGFNRHAHLAQQFGLSIKPNVTAQIAAVPLFAFAGFAVFLVLGVGILNHHCGVAFLAALAYNPVVWTGLGESLVLFAPDLA